MNAVVVDAVRTPYAGVGGALKGWHPVSLLAEVLNAGAQRLGIDPSLFQSVVVGCANPIGEQAANIGRNAVLAAGWSESIPASSVDGGAISGIFALNQIVSLVESGSIELGVAGGVESFSRVPDGATSGVAVGKPFGPLVHQRYEAVGGLLAPGRVGETMATNFRITRDLLDEYAAVSRQRFQTAQKAGIFKNELHNIAVKNAKGTDTASYILEDSILAVKNLTKLKPLFEVDGILTSATFSRPVDGAAATVVANAELAEANNWPTLARIIDIHTVGTDPISGDCGADAVRFLLRRHNLKSADLSRIEVHEDTAVTPLALRRELNLGADKVNPEGGALSIGTAYGATGLTMVSSLGHGLSRNGGRYGAGVIAGSGGMAAVVLLERS